MRVDWIESFFFFQRKMSGSNFKETSTLLGIAFHFFICSFQLFI